VYNFYFNSSDVDTPEPDEKSIIAYVSQLYDVFPEPPSGHPLFDEEAGKKIQHYRELASSLHHWIKEHIVVMQVKKVEIIFAMNLDIKLKQNGWDLLFSGPQFPQHSD